MRLSPKARQWIWAHLALASLVHLVGAVISFGAPGLDPAIARALLARPDPLVVENVIVVPAYVLIALFHAFLTWPLERRRLLRRGPGSERGFGRALIAALPYTVLLLVLGAGPLAVLRPEAARAAGLGGLMLVKAHLLLFVLWLALVVLALIDLVAHLREGGQARAVSASASALLAFLLLSGFHGAEKSGPTSVVVLSVEGLGADRLTGAQGMVNLLQLDKESVVFDQHHTVMPGAVQALTAMMTGRDPLHTTVRSPYTCWDAVRRVSFDSNNLPRELRNKGYQTFLVGDRSAEGLSRIDLGFEEHSVPKDPVLDDYALRAIRNAHPLFALYAALFEPPEHLEPEARLADFIGHIDRAVDAKRPFLGLLSLRFERESDDGEVTDRGLADLDRLLGTLVGHLEQVGLSRSMILVLTADRGAAPPSFSGALQDRATHIPLYIRTASRFGAGKHVGTTTRNIDLKPTLMAMLGFESLSMVDGVSLIDITLGGPAPLLYAEAPTEPAPGELFFDKKLELRPSLIFEKTLPAAERSERMIRSRCWKIVKHFEGRYEFYDLRVDPKQERDLAASPPPEFALLKRTLEKWQRTGQEGGLWADDCASRAH
jgi:hypothetical protein